MTEEGVNGLSLSEVARRLGVKPPSLYKYFDSLMAVFDALFERGQQAHLEVMRDRDGRRAEPGLDALCAPASRPAAAGRSPTQPVAQLLFWRPVPSFEPTPEAMAPSVEMVRLQRQALADAVAAGSSAPAPTPTRRSTSASIFVSGVLGQAMANEPDLPWGKGRFRPLFPKLLGTLAALYPPKPARRRS